MLVCLQSCVTLCWVFYKQFSDEIFGLIAAFMERLAIESVDTFLDAHEDRSHILPIKRRAATQQDVKNNPTCPIIHLFPVLSIDHLWRKIHGSPLGLILKLLLLEDLSNAEVNQFNALDVILFLQQDVLRLEVAMTNVMVVEISNR